MNQVIDDFYDVLFRPALGMERVVAERNHWQGLFVYLFVSFVSSITAFGTAAPTDLAGEYSQLLPPEAMTAILRSWPILNLIILLVFAPFVFLGWSALLHLIAHLLGGKGEVLQLAAGLGYGHLPYILVAPFGLVARYLPLDVVGLASLAALIWSIFLKVEAVRSVYGFSRGRAVLAYFLPFLAMMAAFILFMLLLGTFLTPLLSELFPLQ